MFYLKITILFYEILYNAIIMLLVASPLGCQADNLTQPFSLVPCPVAIVPGTGNFQFTAKTVFAVENEEQAEVVKQFTALFTNAAGFTPRIKTESKKGDVYLLTDASLDSEAYLLEITSKKIRIYASDVQGFFMPCRVSGNYCRLL